MDSDLFSLGGDDFAVGGDEQDMEEQNAQKEQEFSLFDSDALDGFGPASGGDGEEGGDLW